jgi:archaetidylinositol phosphate synthase
MVIWVALAVAAAVLAAVTGFTAQRPDRPVPDRDGYFDRWRRGHGGYDPRDSRMVAGWLTVAFAAARPLARVGAKPDVLTVWTLWVGAVVVALAAEGGAWPVAAGLLVVASGLGDAVDGAVAVLTERTSAWGYVLDSFVDRLNDLLYVAALWVVGAPGWLAAATGVGLLLLEYVRARGNNAGAGEIGVITVGERASRVIAAGATLIAVGFAPEGASVALATVGMAVLAGLTAVGLVQMLVAVRRALAHVRDGGS